MQGGSRTSCPSLLLMAASPHLPWDQQDHLPAPSAMVMTVTTDSLEEEHSSVLPWKTPWTEEPCGLQSMGSQKDQTRLKRLNSSSTGSLGLLGHYSAPWLSLWYPLFWSHLLPFPNSTRFPCWSLELVSAIPSVRLAFPLNVECSCLRNQITCFAMGALLDERDCSLTGLFYALQGF